MATPAFLVKLMRYANLSPRLKIKGEDAMCCAFATELRVATLQGRMNGVWFHPAQELAYGHTTGVRGAIARAMGMHTGVSDYVFLTSDGSYVIEAKYGDNKLSGPQDDFRKWCDASGVPFRTIYSVPEGISALREWGVLSV